MGPCLLQWYWLCRWFWFKKKCFWLHFYVSNVSISLRSRAQKSVTLSRSKAEFVVLSEALKEIMFLTQLLESMGIKNSYIIVAWVHNVRATFMLNNTMTKSQTKHVKIRDKYVNEYINNGVIKIILSKVKKLQWYHDKKFEWRALSHSCK